MTGYTLVENNGNQYNNNYYNETNYWFKFEPLQWRVLDASEGLVVSVKSIDAQPFNNFAVYDGEMYGDSGKQHYANNYYIHRSGNGLTTIFSTRRSPMPRKAILRFPT